jgi:hypothetical protein
MSKQRRAAREKEIADDLLNKLTMKFIRFKNKHFVEADGVLVMDTEVKDMQNVLKAEWVRFCELKSGKGELVYNPKAFHNKVEEHMLSHRKLAYVNHVMRLIDKVYSADMKEYEQIVECFEIGRSCEDAAFELTHHCFKEEVV